jgi:mevalonate kinase
MKETIEKKVYYAHGKLLLTAEYFVLDGAKALAVPTKFGQSLEIMATSAFDNLTWKSFDSDKKMWFEGIFDSKSFELVGSDDAKTGLMLSKILKAARSLNPQFLNLNYAIETHLTFPRQWGLGTSSTLIYNISQLFGVNPYILLKETFGGSGYDIACAGVNSAIFYQLEKGEPIVENALFQPFFKDNLYFIYLGKKQNSRDGIARYREKAKYIPPHREIGTGQYSDEISSISDAFLTVSDLKSFEKLLSEHERLVASFIELPTVKSLYFTDYWGAIKSLGAWGGDFVLATSDRTLEETKVYFNKKGFDTILQYSEMVL